MRTALYLALVPITLAANFDQEALVSRLSLKLNVDAEITRKIVAETVRNEMMTSERILVTPAPAPWGYSCTTSPKYWKDLPGYSLCGTGTAQSPIDIPAIATGHRNTSSTKAKLTSWVKEVETFFDVSQSHEAPKYSCPNVGTCGYILYKNKAFNFVQMHFHGTVLCT
jgi:carbonic anhydrase